MKSWPRLLLGVISVSMGLPQLGSLLLSMTPDTTKGHESIWGLGHHLKPGEGQGADRVI